MKIANSFRAVAFSVVVFLSLEVVRSRPHGGLYAKSSRDLILREARRLALVQEAIAPDIEHVEVADFAQTTKGPGAPTSGPPGGPGSRALGTPVSVIVPLYNEGPFVPSLASRLIDMAKHYQTEVLAIDDGSSDDTLYQLKTLPEGVLRTQHRDVSKGYLPSIRHAMPSMSHDIVMLMDGSARIDGGGLRELLHAITSPQVVAAAAILPTPPGRRLWYWRTWLLRLITRVAMIVLGRRWITDLAPEACLFKRSFLEKVLNFASVEGLHPYTYAALLPGNHQTKDVVLRCNSKPR